MASGRPVAITLVEAPASVQSRTTAPPCRTMRYSYPAMPLSTSEAVQEAASEVRLVVLGPSSSTMGVEGAARSPLLRTNLAASALTYAASDALLPKATYPAVPASKGRSAPSRNQPPWLGMLEFWFCTLITSPPL